MKVLKWFFGISALYGLVRFAKEYFANPDKLKEIMEDRSISKAEMTVLVVLTSFSEGMVWPRNLFDKLVAVPVAVLFALIERNKKRGENAYEDN